MIAGLAVLVALGPGIRDGQDAMDRAAGILTNLGIEGRLEIQTLMLSNFRDQPNSWYVGFSTPKGPATVEMDSRTGKPVRIQGPNWPSRNVQSNLKPTTDGTRKLWRVVERLGLGRELKIDSFSGYRNGPSTATFYVLVHGLPFFNLNPTYAHRVEIDPTTGAIMYFLASPSPPPVNTWKPVVPGSVALRRLKDWGHKRAVAKGMPKEVDPSEGDLRPELGYWKFKNETKARLVWRANKHTTINGESYGMGALRMLLDAVDGKLLEPDDEGWGMNP